MNTFETERIKKQLDSLYCDRERFTVVALTGYTGTGCTTLAEVMESKFEKWKNVRDKFSLMAEKDVVLDNEELYFAGGNNNDIIGSEIFSRKFNICRNFVENHYKEFTVLKYSHAVLFFTLFKFVHEIATDNKRIKSLKEKISELLENKFCPSVEEGRDDDYEGLWTASKDKEPNGDKAKEGDDAKSAYPWIKILNLEGLNFTDEEWEELYEKLIKLNEEIKEEFFSDIQINNIKTKDTFMKLLSEIFFKEESIFRKFTERFMKYLWKADPYCTNFFFHRLSGTIRATGNPLTNSRDVRKLEPGQFENHVFDIVKLINLLIKSHRRLVSDKDCNNTRIVIDKIRNSLEAKFLKERYSAFYFIAVHEEKSVAKHLKERIEMSYDTYKEIENNKKIIDLQIHKIINLDMRERDGKEFEEGRFYSPNTITCVADAEIHISNEQSTNPNAPYFYSMQEQWMKYAALIQHPGLITPSSEERCMVVAYTAKFNSGCLSRQVGAVITNKYHSIRSIGWNDVPYGHIPCSLKNLNEMGLNNFKEKSLQNFVYSRYEMQDIKPFKDGESFHKKVRIKFDKMHLTYAPQTKSDVKDEEANDFDLMKGLPYSYCFKALQNEFEKEKNQVHTRSLHAEENAILQMAKYGGEALKEGVIYVTASPCELCCKKLYQIGIRKIIYIDEYPGISRENIIGSGFQRPRLKQFQGAYGATYFKLFQPFISYKDEISLRTRLSLKESPIEQIQKKFKEMDELLKKLRDLSEKTSADAEMSLSDKLKDLSDKLKKMIDKRFCLPDKKES